MSTLVKVVRYHLVKPDNLVLIPWAALVVGFIINVVVLAIVNVRIPGTTSGGQVPVRYMGTLATLFVTFAVAGVTSATRALPLGLSLGLSRRSFYLGTVLTAVSLAVVYGLILALLQAIERWTHGWGLSMGVFRAPFVLEGPWYLTWLMSFVLLTLVFVWGVWFGLVYRRWNLIGLWAFVAAQVIVGVAAALVVTWIGAWHHVGHFFVTVSAPGIGGMIALLATLLLAGGFATVRRAAV